MKGEVVYYYAFDVANEVIAARVSKVMGQCPEPLTVRLKHAAPKDVAFHRPLAVPGPALASSLGGQPVGVEVHVFDVGVVNVVFRVAFDLPGLAELKSFHHPILENGRSLDGVAADLCAEVCRDLDGALARPSAPPEPEAYTVFRLNDIGADADATGWFAAERPAIAGLLNGLDAGRLSEAQIAETLRIHWSLERDDLVVIDWDAALVVDLSDQAEDVLYVLEVANLQLDEFRTMDQALDRYLNQAYRDLERGGAVTLFGSASPVLRKLRLFRVDLTKLADEVTNITKFVGDWYLARVYLGARERFHLDRWRGSVETRLAQLDQLYGVAQSELYERRLLWLEFVIVLFFAIDLIALFCWRR